MLVCIKNNTIISAAEKLKQMMDGKFIHKNKQIFVTIKYNYPAPSKRKRYTGTSNTGTGELCVCIWEHADNVFDKIKTANKETWWGGGGGRKASGAALYMIT